VFIAGERVLACEVRTKAIEYRDDIEPMLPHESPAEIAHTSLLVARTLGLLWTGIDYRLTPEHYVFLEAYASPMSPGFES
jgi:hypothetical protein